MYPYFESPKTLSLSHSSIACQISTTLQWGGATYLRVGDYISRFPLRYDKMLSQMLQCGNKMLPHLSIVMNIQSTGATQVYTSTNPTFIAS